MRGGWPGGGVLGRGNAGARAERCVSANTFGEIK